MPLLSKRATFAAVALLALAPACAAPDASSPIRLNQLGILPDGVKRAVLPDRSDGPLAWKLVDAQGKVQASGMTTMIGDDAASGEHLHLIDFTNFHGTGANFHLTAGTVSSRPFAIEPGLYPPLAHAALNYFYQSRAGIPIEARYAGGAQWARPAGHPHERVSCVSGTDDLGNRWPGCSYTLDVTGGWYDAGDQGKYVVNGGIALWTLLDLYEQYRPFPDGSAALPEAGNGTSDLLDEARWEMEFLLKMQVPAGATMKLPVGVTKPARSLPFTAVDVSGMAHHKVADEHWTKLPTPPQDDREKRMLFPPTTAATLNLAATAAQCARIWRTIDPAFASRCLAAATRAWEAAKRNPAIFPVTAYSGSGGYGDAAVDDEFYWAAAELFASTGGAEYRAAIERSSHFQQSPASEFGWQSTATLGTITLATQPNALPAAERVRLRQSLIAAADGFLADEAKVGYRIPYAPPYTWGSNSNLLNRAIILALAHDFTGEERYRGGVVDSIDYILGRNPLDRSFVTGFGARPMAHPHHRFWAQALDPRMPPPPPGVLSGGPNSVAMVDTVALKLRGKCAPQLCWRDETYAYSLNEVAINWNAPLVWVSTWLAAPRRE